MKQSARIMMSFLIAFGFTISQAQQETVRVGVLQFTEGGAKSVKSGQSDVIVARITDSMGAYRFIRLVEQDKVSAIMEEIAKGMSGMQDDSTIAQAGKLHGIQIMVTGTVSGDRVFGRAIHVETGGILSSASSGMSDIETIGKKLAAGIESFLARENLKRMRNDSPGIDFNFWAEKAGGKKITEGGSGKASIGSRIVFRFRSNIDGYCTIVDIQPNGDVGVLFPNESQPDNRVVAGREYSIPSADDSFEITVTEPAGIDTVVAFFTRNKVDWLDRKKLSGEGFLSVKEGEKLSLSRGITVTATKIKASDWESKTLSIDVVK